MRLIPMQVQGYRHHRDLQHQERRYDIAPERQVQHSVEVLHFLTPLVQVVSGRTGGDSAQVTPVFARCDTGSTL
jgi:hypothetical protein